ncbi:hypothetical protein HY411_00660 [Candidatus Gottesmanbacteria bacterium]|nr:hypothetical protein [Candidatus Gottesmanbacteria bacterium]
MPEQTFKNPSLGYAQELLKRWKDVPWRGDVLLRIGHTSLWGDIERTFRTDIKGRPNFFLRALGLLGTIPGWLGGKLNRDNFYNPFTNTVHVFRPVLATGMHEVGHAKFFDERTHRNLWVGATLLPFIIDRLIAPWPFLRIPIYTSFLEWQANVRAMKQFFTDTEREEALRVMEPAFGTYLPTDVLSLAAPFIPGGFAWMLAAPIAGAVAGHIVNRLPWNGIKDRKERFGYVFEGKKAPVADALDDTQVRFASARAPATSRKI